MGGIFINYRRQDTAYIAGRLHDRLAAHFGPRQIFRDIDTMKPGVDFGERIADAIGECGALLVVIGDGWLDSRDAQGRRRLDDPDDWVRQEIEEALARPDVLVIPVLVEDAPMPSEEDLPPSMRALSRRNAMELTDRRWDYEVGRLIEALEEVVEPEAAPKAVAPSGGQAGGSPSDGAWSPRGATAGPPPWSAAGGGRTPAAPAAPAKPRIPTWLKVTVPILVLAVLIVIPSVVLVSNLTDRADEGSSTTIGRLTSTTGRSSTTASPSTTRVIIGPFKGQSGALALTVQKLEVASNRVRVHLLVENGTSDGLTLPASRFTAVDSTGHNYEVDPFSKEWRQAIPPRTSSAGIIDLEEPLAQGATSMKVGWSVVFGSPQVRSIFVDRVVLTRS